MKKEYKKPTAEIINFAPDDNIMDDNIDIEGDDDMIGGSSLENWG